MIRILIATVGFVGAIFLPVWVPITAILISAFFWRASEAMLLGLFVDFLWLPVGGVPWVTLGAVAVVWLFEPIRSEFLSRQ
ncbi:MAG TPA: hypothetical protein VJG64_04765 [Candidatus Paceibacterota bacterium]